MLETRQPLPPVEREALRHALTVMSLLTPDHFRMVTTHCRVFLWHDCGGGADACAALDGDTIKLSRCSSLTLCERAGLILHETLHLMGLEHDCEDELCSDVADKQNDFIYDYCKRYREALGDHLAELGFLV